VDVGSVKDGQEVGHKHDAEDGGRGATIADAGANVVVPVDGGELEVGGHGREDDRKAVGEIEAEPGHVVVDVLQRDREVSQRSARRADEEVLAELDRVLIVRVVVDKRVDVVLDGRGQDEVGGARVDNG